MEKREILINGEVYIIDTRKSKDKSRKGVFDLIVINKETKKKNVFNSIFSYTEGWSQGTGRSVKGYYLNIEGYGSVGNGNGRSTMDKPYITYDILEFLTEAFGSKHYNSKINETYKMY